MPFRLAALKKKKKKSSATGLCCIVIKHPTHWRTTGWGSAVKLYYDRKRRGLRGGEKGLSISGFSHRVIFITFRPWYTRYGYWVPSGATTELGPHDLRTGHCAAGFWRREHGRLLIKTKMKFVFSVGKGAWLHYSFLWQSWVILWLMRCLQCSRLMVTGAPPRNPIVRRIIKAAGEDIVNDTLARSTLTLKWADSAAQEELTVNKRTRGHRADDNHAHIPSSSS